MMCNFEPGDLVRVRTEYDPSGYIQDQNLYDQVGEYQGIQTRLKSPLDQYRRALEPKNFHVVLMKNGNKYFFKESDLEKVNKGFSGDLIVKQVDETTWKVQQSFVYQANFDRITVQRGQKTDFASIPRPMLPLIQTYGDYSKSVVLHDYLYREKVAHGYLTHREADAILRQSMRLINVAFIKRWVVWSAVRWYSIFGRRDFKNALKDLPLMLLWTLLALPFVAPAFVVNTVTIFIVWIVEFLFYIPIRVLGNKKRKVKPKLHG